MDATSTNMDEVTGTNMDEVTSMEEAGAVVIDTEFVYLVITCTC